MAYVQNWNPDNKLSEKEAIAFLTRVVPDITDNAFHIRKESDDGGSVISVYIEMNEDGSRGYHNKPVKYDEFPGSATMPSGKPNESSSSAVYSFPGSGKINLNRVST